MTSLTMKMNALLLVEYIFVAFNKEFAVWCRVDNSALLVERKEKIILDIYRNKNSYGMHMLARIGPLAVHYDLVHDELF